MKIVSCVVSILFKEMYVNILYMILVKTFLRIVLKRADLVQVLHHSYSLENILKHFSYTLKRVFFNKLIYQRLSNGAQYRRMLLGPYFSADVCVRGALNELLHSALNLGIFTLRAYSRIQEE